MKLFVYAPVAIVLSMALALPQPAVAMGAAQPAVAPAAAGPETMTDEQKMERAKALYGEGNAALEAGDPYTALAKFEEAYFTYAPQLHVFNYNIGVSAYDSGNCAKARDAFQRFLDLVPEHDQRGDAQVKVMEIDRSGCAQTQPTPAPVETTPTPSIAESAPILEDEGEDAPILESRATERERAADEEREQEKTGKRSGMFIGGVIMLSVGLGSLVGSGISLILARQKAKRLAELASPTDIGFPSGDYSDEEVFDLETKKLPANNAATWILLGAGVALTATGIALLVVDKKKNGGGKRAKKDGAALTGLGPTVLPRGAGMAASVAF